MTVRRALLSVSNKDGLLEFAQALHKRGVAMLSTGGTATLLERGGVPVTQVSSHTGFPEIMDGRVKTLHPKIHGGLLGRRDVDDAVMRQHGIEPIDLLVVNLYPFAATIAQAGLHLRGRHREHRHRRSRDGARRGEESRPRRGDRRSARLRGGARRAVERRWRDLGSDAQAARREGVTRTRRATTPRSRAYLARVNEGAGEFAQSLTLQFQQAHGSALRRKPASDGGVLSRAGGAGRQHRRPRSSCRARTLSYNNIADGDTAFECVRQFADPACVIVKHANPCGVAVASDTLAAYDRAYKTDPTSAFGGIIAFNRAAHGQHGARDPRAPVRRADHRSASRRGGARAVHAQRERARAGDRRTRAQQPAVTSTAASTAACSCRRATRAWSARPI